MFIFLKLHWGSKFGKKACQRAKRKFPISVRVPTAERVVWLLIHQKSRVSSESMKSVMNKLIKFGGNCPAANERAVRRVARTYYEYVTSQGLDQ